MSPRIVTNSRDFCPTLGTWPRSGLAHPHNATKSKLRRPTIPWSEIICTGCPHYPAGNSSRAHTGLSHRFAHSTAALIAPPSDENPTLEGFSPPLAREIPPSPRPDDCGTPTPPRRDLGPRARNARGAHLLRWTASSGRGSTQPAPLIRAHHRTIDGREEPPGPLHQKPSTDWHAQTVMRRGNLPRRRAIPPMAAFPECGRPSTGRRFP